MEYLIHTGSGSMPHLTPVAAMVPHPATTALVPRSQAYTPGMYAGHRRESTVALPASVTGRLDVEGAIRARAPRVENPTVAGGAGIGGFMYRINAPVNAGGRVLPVSGRVPNVETGSNRRVLRPWDWQFGPAMLGGVPAGIEKRHALTEHERSMMSEEEIRAYNDLLEGVGGPVPGPGVGAPLPSYPGDKALADRAAVGAAWQRDLRSYEEERRRNSTTARGVDVVRADPVTVKSIVDWLGAAQLEELYAFLREMKVKNLQELLEQYESLMGETGLTDEQRIELLSRIEALRQHLSRPKSAAKQGPVVAPPRVWQPGQVPRDAEDRAVQGEYNGGVTEVEDALRGIGRVATLDELVSAQGEYGRVLAGSGLKTRERARLEGSWDRLNEEIRNRW